MYSSSRDSNTSERNFFQLAPSLPKSSNQEWRTCHRPIGTIKDQRTTAVARKKGVHNTKSQKESTTESTMTVSECQTHSCVAYMYADSNTDRMYECAPSLKRSISLPTNEIKNKKHRFQHDPLRLSFDHSPNHWRSQKHPESDSLVFTSNKAYQDLLDGTLKTHLVTACTLESHHRTERSCGTYSFFHKHVLRYRGQVVWSLETRNHCNPLRTWGVRSTCTITHDNKLKVDLFPTHETRIYNLEGILLQAAHSEPMRGVPLRGHDMHQ